MTPEITLLIISAATIAIVHIILGPDHYLPFVAMSKVKNLSRFERFGHAIADSKTLLCGLGVVFLGLQEKT